MTSVLTINLIGQVLFLVNLYIYLTHISLLIQKYFLWKLARCLQIVYAKEICSRDAPGEQLIDKLNEVLNMKNLNKSLIATLVLGLLGANAQAASSADITLSGSVDQDCSVALNSSNYTVNLLSGESDSTVATVTETCNDSDGYQISFSSANAGVLQNDDDASEQKSYSISYGTDLNYARLLESKSVSYNTYTAGNAVPLRMNLDAHTSGVLAAGTWSDTITVSIAAIQ